MGRRRSPGIEFVPDPIGYLEAFAETGRVEVWRFAVDRHYTYEAVDQSGITADVRVRPCFDHKPDCWTCRPYVIDRESDRILEAFGQQDAFLDVVAGSDRERVRRRAGRLGCSYVFVPCGPGVVLSTAPVSEHSVELIDLRHALKDLVMPLRWRGSVTGSRGFLPPGREPGFWEAHHPSTARRCYHAHYSKGKAQVCARDMGNTLDGSSKGWYVRRASEWRQLGTIRLDKERLKSRRQEDAKRTNSEVVLDELEHIAVLAGFETGSGGSVRREAGQLVFNPMAWEDSRFVEFRRLTRWRPPARPGARWLPPVMPVPFRVNGREIATGAS